MTVACCGNTWCWTVLRFRLTDEDIFYWQDKSRREVYPQGENYLVSPAVTKPYQLRRANLIFIACSTGDLPE